MQLLSVVLVNIDALDSGRQHCLAPGNIHISICRLILGNVDASLMPCLRTQGGVRV